MQTEKEAVICPVCGSSQTKHLFWAFDILYQVTDKEFGIRKCQDCQALFISPFPSKEEAATYYPKTYYSYETGAKEGFFERLKRNIIKYHFEPQTEFSLLDKLLIKIFKGKYSGLPLYKKEDGKFLDIGCGSGENLKILSQYGWQTFGIELDENAVAYARQNNLNVEKATLEEADFGAKHFDAIRIWHVFEHLTTPGESMKKLASLLADNGEILMAVPNAESWARKIFRAYWYGLDVPRHVISYCPATLGKMFEQNNLYIKDIKYASCGWLVGSFSNFLRKKVGFKGNLINTSFLIWLFSPLDFLSDLMHKGDTIFLTIKKK